jgi:hypothetical protein
MKFVRRLVVLAVVAALVYRGLRYLGVVGRGGGGYDDPFTVPTDEEL